MSSIGREFSGVTESLDPARQMVANFVASLNSTAESIERSKLVVSELVTNAIQFAPGKSITVLARSGDQVVVLEVRSFGHSREVPTHGEFPAVEDGQLALGRRGLAIVHAICRSVKTVDHGDGTFSVLGVLPLTV